MNSGVNRALRNFSIFTAFATLCLICVGGVVTSKNVGMAVPDWPTSYGYHMFFLPFANWTGGAFHEHTHRLIASIVGLLTAALAIWIWIEETSGKARRNAIITITAILIVIGGMFGVRKTAVFVTIASLGLIGTVVGLFRNRNITGVRWFGFAALCAVIVQGVLGGLRVTEMKDEIGIFHAMLAQGFLVLIAAIALTQTQWWKSLPVREAADDRGFRMLFITTTVLIVVQLGIAAIMRHQHAGLSISDFPLAHGALWPATDPASIAAYNAKRQEVAGENDITAFQIYLQMAHRIVALAILIAVAFCAGKTRKYLTWKNPITKMATLWLGLIVVQVFLGAATIWTDKAADVATAHVAVGALSLVTGSLLAIVSFRILAPRGQNNLAPSASSPFISQPVASSR